jgi:hypothetical protein
MSDGRPPKVPKTAHGRPPEVPKVPDIRLGNVFDEIPETNDIRLGTVFDCACEEWTEAREAGKKLNCRLIWTEFYKTNPVFLESFSGWRAHMTRIDTSTHQLWKKQTLMQTEVEQVIIQQYCSEFSTIESQKYLNNIFSTLEKKDVNGNTMSVAVCADVLFRRLVATFGPSAYQNMETWFRAIPARNFDWKLAPPCGKDEMGEDVFPHFSHTITDTTKRVAEVSGVPCLMFAMCVYLAANQLDDVTFEGDLQEIFKSIVFSRRRPYKKNPALHYDFMILELQVLDRLEWKTHVTVGSYAASVETMPGLPEQDKEEILKMLADNDKLHLAEFGLPLVVKPSSV